MIKSLFATKLGDNDTKDKDELGVLRREHDVLLGERMYQYVRNFSGGSLTKGDLVGWEALSESAITAAANTDLKKIKRNAGTWVEGELVGFYVRVLDNNSAAGTAPEGDVRRIVANSADTLTVDTDFTAAVTTSDTFEIHRPHHIIAAADGMVAAEVAGVLMATLADKEFGWVQRRGLHPAVPIVAEATALAAGAAVKVAAKIAVVAADAADNGEIIGYNVFAVTADTDLRTALIRLALP